MTATHNLKDLAQGSSTFPTFQYTENDGTPIDISSVENIRVLFRTDNGRDLSKYSKTPLTGWNSNDFVVIDDTDGIFGIKIQSSETKNWNIGVVKFEIEILTTVSGFTPSYKTILAERIYNVTANKIELL